LGGDPKYKGFWGYLNLKGSISFLRGFTYFKSDHFESGMSVFDVPVSLLNYLKVKFVTYDSMEDYQ